VDGSLGFGAAVSKYSDDDGSKFSAGAVTGRDGSSFITLDQVDKEMVIALKDMKPGTFSKPQVFTDERGSKKVRIIYLKNRTEPHRENLKEDYNRIASRALDGKKVKSWKNGLRNISLLTIFQLTNSFQTVKAWKTG
jgi:peptidyl-prolyl cis-trans isomerase SurA